MIRVFSGLRFRLFLLVLLTCAPLVALTLHTAGEERRRALENWRQRSQRMLQISQQEEQAAVAAGRQLLLAISESSPVHSLDPGKAAEYLSDLLKTYPRYFNLGIISTNGTLLASARPVLNRDQTAPQLFRKVLETRTFALGALSSDAERNPAVVAFGYPILDDSDRMLAVLYADLDLRKSGPRTQLRGQLPPQASWTQIDRRGTILARFPAPEQWVGRQMTDRSLVDSAFVHPGQVVQRTQAGVPMVYAFRAAPSHLASGDEGTILAIPQRAIFARADLLLQRNLTWLGIAACVAIALGWIGSQLLILHPVHALVRTSARLAAGDLGARTGLAHGHDELGQLTFAFDKMAGALEHRERERERANRKLQALSQRLVEVQESERRHIARELHDEIGQSLTVAEMNLQAALQTSSRAALDRRLQEGIRAVERVLEQVHDLSLNLRPSILDDLGLAPALRWYTQRQAALTGMKAEFCAEALDERFNPVVETECFRVAQEALTNVVRHAQAHAVKVELTRLNGHLHLSVRDDGVGFDVHASRGEAVQGASLGLLSMEERASLAGGGLEFNSSPGRGTEVHAWFPLESQGLKTTSEFDE